MLLLLSLLHHTTPGSSHGWPQWTKLWHPESPACNHSCIPPV